MLRKLGVSLPRFLVLVFRRRLFLATTRMRCMRTSQHEIQHADGYLAVCLNYYSEETKLYGVMVRLFLYFFARLTGKLLLWLWLPTSEFIGFQITAFRAARPNENRANLKHAADVRKSLIANGQMSGVIPLRNHVQNIYCCAVWPIKCRQGSKTNKSNCQFWKKLTFDWLVESPSQGLFGQRPQ